MCLGLRENDTKAMLPDEIEIFVGLPGVWQRIFSHKDPLSAESVRVVEE
jgi:hypothetical protein